MTTVNETISSKEGGSFQDFKMNDASKAEPLQNTNNIVHDEIKIVTIGPSKPHSNFYQHYHSYIPVIIIAIVIALIVFSAIYVGIRNRRRNTKSKPRRRRKKDKRPLLKRSTSGHSSQSLQSSYQSFASRIRSNNRYGRLTSQRSWANFRLTATDNPFQEEALNKSLPASLEPGSIHMSPLSHQQYVHQFNSEAVSVNTARSSTADLTKFSRKQDALFACYGIGPASDCAESSLENKRRHTPLPELESGKGIVVQISNMDVISSVVPRNPFPDQRTSKSLTFTSTTASPKSSSDSLPPSMSSLDTSSGEFKLLKTVSEEFIKDRSNSLSLDTAATNDTKLNSRYATFQS